MISQVHKDALARLGNGVYSFSDHGFGVVAGGNHGAANVDNATSGVWMDDPQYAYQKAELLQELVSAGSKEGSGKVNYEYTRDDNGNTEVYVTFVEPVIVGCLGPWSLLKRGVEISSSSPLAGFSPLIPFVNAMQLTFQFDQNLLAQNLFCLVRNGASDAGGAQGACSATFEAAQVMCKFIMPPPSHQSKRMNSFPLPSFDVVRYEKAGSGEMPSKGAPAESGIDYVNYDEAPSYLQFCVRPSAKMYPSILLVHSVAADSNSRLVVEKQRLQAKKFNFEITKIDMSINTSTAVLQQPAEVELGRAEMDRMTLENCCSLSAFPYDRMAFRKYRHFVLLKMEQLSGLFSTPGAADRLTI